MKATFQYKTQEEREFIISNQVNSYLVEEHNIAEGNFLVFSTDKPIGVEIEELRLEMARGNSELFETMIMLTGGGF